MKTSRISYPTPPGKSKKNWYASGIDVEPISTHGSFATHNRVIKEKEVNKQKQVDDLNK